MTTVKVNFPNGSRFSFESETLPTSASEFLELLASKSEESGVGTSLSNTDVTATLIDSRDGVKFKENYTVSGDNVIPETMDATGQKPSKVRVVVTAKSKSMGIDNYELEEFKRVLNVRVSRLEDSMSRVQETLNDLIRDAEEEFQELRRYVNSVEVAEDDREYDEEDKEACEQDRVDELMKFSRSNLINHAMRMDISVGPLDTKKDLILRIIEEEQG